ncbi:hypothetical protein L9F63_011848, partial [Diploptera punctata]
VNQAPNSYCDAIIEIFGDAEEAYVVFASTCFVFTRTRNQLRLFHVGTLMPSVVQDTCRKYEPCYIIRCSLKRQVSSWILLVYSAQCTLIYLCV